MRSCFETEFHGVANLATARAPQCRTGCRGAPAGTPIWQVEKLHLEKTLALTDGNRTVAAEMLGISLRTLRNKIREYGLAAKEVCITWRRLRSCSCCRAISRSLPIASRWWQQTWPIVDTPGYHVKDINFQSAMQQVMNETSGGPQADPATVEVEGLPERPDGNNVNIDRESMLLSRRNFNTRWACS